MKRTLIASMAALMAAVPVAEARGSVGAEIREGLALVWNNRTLRSLALVAGAWQVLHHMQIAVLILFATRDLGLSAGALGMAYMAGGLGCVFAATFAERLARRFGVGPLIVYGLLLTAFGWQVFGLTRGTGGVAAVPPLRGDSITTSEPWRVTWGSSPGARSTTIRTSGTAISGCSKAVTSDTGPPGSGAMRGSSCSWRRAPGTLTTTVSASGWCTTYSSGRSATTTRVDWSNEVTVEADSLGVVVGGGPGGPSAAVPGNSDSNGGRAVIRIASPPTATNRGMSRLGKAASGSCAAGGW